MIEGQIKAEVGDLIVDSANPNKADWVAAALRRYEGPLIRYATEITGDVERARDVTQDTFVKLCAADPAELDGRLAQWLFTVCRNRALDVRRKESRMTTLEDKQLDGHESGEPSPAIAAERSEESGRISRLLAALPSKQREVVRLKFQNGLSYQEISGITNLTVTNVGFLLHTALKTIRQQLADETRPPQNLRSVL
jgi:RNA polymerase sigma factor (sigma-70 family)